MGLGTMYLLAYNVVQTAGWSFLAYQMGTHFASGGKPETLWPHVSLTVMVFQTLAVLEILHCILRLVRSNVIVTAVQVASRLILVWYVCYMSEESRRSLGVVMMLTAWSVTEIIRYSYYACNLLGSEPFVLQWLRYTTFIILYPIGVTGELLCCYAALPFYQKKLPFSIALPNPLNVTFDSHVTLILIMLNYLPFFPQLYLHMFAQRKKILGRKKAE